jgi:hypothetical protein
VLAAIALVLLTASRVIVTEVMANPAGTSSAHGPEDRNEYVEVYNASSQAVDLYDWTLDDGDALDRLIAWTDSSILLAAPRIVINSTWLAPGRYAVILDSEYTDPNPIGGYVQPYRFGDGTVILTTRNTTLGNGLAGADPVVVASAYGDTSTFGTPLDASDAIPRDAGDGKSWERVRLAGSDTVTNWQPSIDPEGCTPGRANSVATLVELGITGIAATDSAPPQPGKNVLCSIGLSSTGAVAADGWNLLVWLDRNGNASPEPDEELALFPGWPVAPDADTSVAVQFVCPAGNCDLWAKLTCPEDRDTLDNLCRLSIAPGSADRMFSLGLSSFSPDRDGVEDSLPILFRFPSTGGTLTIVVFDLAGRQVRNLRSGSVATSSGIVCWNGDTDNRRPAAPGIYAVRMEYRKSGTTRVERLPVVLLRK